MPVLKCSNGKFRIGTGPCIYTTKAKAEKAYAAYRAKQAQEVNTTQSRQIFINDSEPHDISFQDHEGGATLVKGIPLMHPGHYQGRDYTEEYLTQIADNFAVVKEKDSFVPAVLPRHSFDHDGKMTGVSGDEIMGHWRGLYMDGATLKGDAEIVDEKDVANIRRGRTRYWSTEVDHAYQLDDGEEIGPAIVGAATVTYPQIRAMPTQIVANSKEFIPEENGGVQIMGVVDKVKEILGLGELTDEQAEALGALEPEEEAPESLSATPTGHQPDTDGGDNPPTGGSNVQPPPELAALQAQVRQEQKAREEQGKEITALREERRVEKTEAQVDELVRGGIVPPSGRQQAFLLLNSLAGDERKVQVLSKGPEGEDVTEDKAIVEVLTDLLTLQKPDIPTELRGGAWAGSEADLTPGHEEGTISMHGTGLEEDAEADAFVGIKKDKE